MISYLVTVLLFATGIISDSADTATLSSSKDQADHYLSHIAEERQAPLHYWALNQLAKDKQTLDAYIKRNIQRYNLPTGYAVSFTDPDNIGELPDNLSIYQKRIAGAALRTGSPLLMLTLLSSMEDPSIREEMFHLYQEKPVSSYDSPFFSKELLSRTAKGEQINTDVLPISSISFAHYIFTLYNGNLLPDQYREKALEEWENIIEHYSSEKDSSLSATIKKAAILHFAFDLRKPTIIVKLYDALLQENNFPNSNLKQLLYKIQDLGTYRLGYFEKALTLHEQKSIPLAQYLEDRESELFFLKHKGIFLYELGNLKKSQETYLQVLDKIDEYELDILTKKIDILNNLSLTYYKRGYYHTYLNYQSQALELAKKHDEYRYQLEIYRNLHLYHRLNQNWQPAQQNLEKAQQIASNHGKVRDLAAIYVTTSTYYKEFKSDLVEAEKWLEKAQALVSTDTYYNQYVKILSERGKLYQKMGKFDKARQNFTKLSKLNKDKNDTRNYVNALIRIVNLELELQNFDKAKELLAEIKQYDLSIVDFELVVKYKSMQALLHHHEDRTDKALQIIKPAISQIIQRARQSSDIRAGYWHIEPEYIDVLKTGVDLYLANNQSYQAIKLLDRIKTINEAELLKNPLIKSTEMSQKELAREQQINEKLNRLRKQYLSADDRENELALKNQINQLKVQRDQLYGDHSHLYSRNDFSIRYIQHQLSYAQLVLHVTELKDTFYIGYIGNNRVSVKQIPINDNIRSLFETSIDSLAQARTDLNNLHSIYTLLRLHEIPNYIDQISLIPDSYLYQLPIEILPVDQPTHSYSYGSSRYLIENIKVNYHTSLSQFNQPYQKNRKLRYDFVGFGVTDFINAPKKLVPLPFAEREIQNIDKQLTRLNPKKTFINRQATEQNFRSAASQSHIIHLATHSTINNQEPLFSSIYLHSQKNSQSENESKGRIFAYELFEMNLNNQLIMMNSCESGSGPYIQGSGVMGLSRSLKYAGGNSLILNLWSVNDKYASEFATQLYRYLNEGESKAAAMQKAKQIFLQNNNANPHYWGPYMLLGDPSPIVTQEYSLFRFLTFGGFLIVLLVGINIIYYRGNRITR